MSACLPGAKLFTLAIIHKDDKVLLGKKKRGFGAGYYNGFGGKVEEAESITEAAHRELKEECGIDATNLEQQGVLWFKFDDNPQPWEVHVFAGSAYDGYPVETEEMLPVWFQRSELPFDQMWADDILWYPHVLKGEKFKGVFMFENTTQLVSHCLIQEDDLKSFPAQFRESIRHEM